MNEKKKLKVIAVKEETYNRIKKLLHHNGRSSADSVVSYLLDLEEKHGNN